MVPYKKAWVESKRTKKALTPKGFVFHETATPGATAQNEHDYIQNHSEVTAFAHIYVDWTQALEVSPLTEKCWHAYSPANDMFVGLEICHVKDGSDGAAAKFNAAYESAAEIIANKMYWNFKIDTVSKDNCMSHHEVTLKWKHGDHTDPTAYFKLYGKTADMFRARVQYYIDQIKARQGK